MAGDDFVMVQLTEHGVELAGGAPIRVSNGRRTFVFEPGVPQRVERSYEWHGVLSKHVTPNGLQLFELVPALQADTEAALATSIQEEEK